MKKIIPFIAIILFLAGCGGSIEEQRRQSKIEKARQDSIYRAAFKVAVMPTMDCLPLFVAKEQRMFDTLGIDVRLPLYTAQMDCDTALLGGSVEGSVTDLVRYYYLNKKGAGLEARIATGTYWQLVTNRLSRIKHLNQLSDKMIAVTRNSATDMLATMAIDSAKPKFDVYRVQVNDVKIRLEMLLNNEMDAMLLTEPQATVARQHDNPVLMDTRDKNLCLGVIAFKSKNVASKERRHQYERFVKAYDMAVDSINKYGVQHYAAAVKKYCGCSDKTIQRLPKLVYRHASKPRPGDMEKAAGYVK